MNFFTSLGIFTSEYHKGGCLSDDDGQDSTVASILVLMSWGVTVNCRFDILF